MTNSNKCVIIGRMFDRLIYKFLDTIINWCERYKEYRISRTIPKPSKKELKKWLKNKEKSYK